MEQALSEAISRGSLEECESLLSTGADVNHPDSHGWSPLCLALSRGHTQLVQFLLQSGADVNGQNPYGVGALALAAALDDEALLALIYNQMTPDSRKEHNDSALRVACLKGFYKSVQWLLTNTPAKVNAVSSTTGVSALHLAVIGGHRRVVEILLVFGADPSIPNALGQTSLDLAEKQDKRDSKLLTLLQRTSSSKQREKKQKRQLVEPQFTANNIILDVGGDVVLKNSPNRPVFGKSDEVEQEIKALLSPSMRSVFMEESPLAKSTPKGDKTQFLLVSDINNQGCVKKQPKKTRQRKKFTPAVQGDNDKNLTSTRARMVFRESLNSPTVEIPQKEIKSSFLNEFLLTPLKNSIKKSRKRDRDQFETPTQEKRATPQAAKANKVRKLSYVLTDSYSFEEQTEGMHAELEQAFISSPSLNNMFSSPTTKIRSERNLTNSKLSLQTPEQQKEGCEKLTYNQTHESRYLLSLLSPEYDQKTNPFRRGKKRSFFDKMKWLKALTKRKASRSKSLDNSGDYINFDELKDDGIDFQQLLYNHGLDEFNTIFIEQELDFSTFVTIERSDLTSMGIEDQASQDKILEGVKKFSQIKL